MKYCHNCGAQVDEKAAICVHCGVSLELPTIQSVLAKDDAPNKGLAVLSFFFPLIGFILYAMNSGTMPKKAKSCLKGAIAGFITSFVFTFLFYIVYFVLIFMFEGAICIGL